MLQLSPVSLNRPDNDLPAARERSINVSLPETKGGCLLLFRSRAPSLIHGIFQEETPGGVQTDRLLSALKGISCASLSLILSSLDGNTVNMLIKEL